MFWWNPCLLLCACRRGTWLRRRVVASKRKWWLDTGSLCTLRMSDDSMTIKSPNHSSGPYYMPLSFTRAPRNGVPWPWGHWWHRRCPKDSDASDDPCTGWAASWMCSLERAWGQGIWQPSRECQAPWALMPEATDSFWSPAQPAWPASTRGSQLFCFKDRFWAVLTLGSFYKIKYA